MSDLPVASFTITQLDGTKHTVIVDAEDLPKLQAMGKWSVSKSKNTHYVYRKQRTENGKTINLYLHRFLLNPAAGLMTDHINGNGLDNRKANLRAVTPQINQQNQWKNPNRASRFRNVVLNHRGDWVVLLRLDGKTTYIASFSNELEAAYAAHLARSTYYPGTNEARHQISEYVNPQKVAEKFFAAVARIEAKKASAISTQEAA